jgi:3D (Asp-Asp-Asp) domain-containing protein
MKRHRVYLLAGLLLLTAVLAPQSGVEWSTALRLMPPLHQQEELARTREQLQKATDLLAACFGEQVDPGTLSTTAVTITAYASTRDQCDDTPHITAAGRSVRVGVLAVSDDLYRELKLSYGQRVLIPGYGLFEVHDRMDRRWKRRVDIWESDPEAARRFGHQKGVLICNATEREQV